MSNPNTRKSCVVPKCTNTTTNAPEKLFFLVPMDGQMRKTWIKAMKRLDSFGAKSAVYCCEDHFDIETDMENYVKYKLVGGRIKLKKGTIPHKFICQQEKKDKPKRTAIQKQNHIKYVKTLLSKDKDTITPMSNETKKPEEVFLNEHETVTEAPKIISNKGKVKSEDGICSLCLSCNRHLQPLGDYSEILLKIAKKNTLVLENLNIPALPVCWECVALLRKVIKFQQQVEDAQVSFHLAKLQNENFQSLSTLTSVITREEEIDIKIETNPEIDEDVKQNIVIKSEPDFGDTEFLEPESSEKVKTFNDDIQIDIEPDFRYTEFLKPELSENNVTKKTTETKEVEVEKIRKRKRAKTVKCLILECNKMFPGKGAMMNHYNYNHLKKTNFHCEKCNQYFPKAYYLNRHNLYKHEGGVRELKYHCSICKKGFHSREVYTHHYHTHTGERPHECPYCSARFIQKYAMKSHVKSRHSNEEEIPG